jgi:ABC-type bacteriocin/lantibiotic exporter with double-glycine peptidase domain
LAVSIKTTLITKNTGCRNKIFLFYLQFYPIALVIFGASLLLLILSLMSKIFYKIILDYVSLGVNLKMFFIFFIVLLVLSCSRILISTVINKISTLFEAATAKYLIDEFHKKLSLLSPSSFERYNKGEILHCYADIEIINQFLTVYLISLFTSFVDASISVVIMTLYS